jgi:hypothetical protein
MATHYPHRAAIGNEQGLHYNDFSPVIHSRTQAIQLLARAVGSKIARIRRESAKLG